MPAWGFLDRPHRATTALLVGLGSASLVAASPNSHHGAGPLRGAATASVAPTVETGPSHHAGDTADDPAIWIHPSDPSLSLVIGDDKNGGLMVYGLDGKEIQSVSGTHYNNVDLRYDFPLAGQFGDGTAHRTVALIGVGDERNKQVDFLKVNPAARRLEPAGSIATANGAVPYGSCMYRSPVSGKFYYFITAKSGVTQQWELGDGDDGTVTGTMVRQFDVGSQIEGCVADDVLARFYVGEEAVGVWKYGAEPDAGSARVQVDKTGTGGHLAADVEGMTLYYAGDGKGYLIVSSQGNSTFAVYARDGANGFLGSFRVGGSGTIDEVTGSDGVEVTNLPLGGTFTKGLFVVHDAANAGARASNFKYVPWEAIASALGLAIDTTWDPRRIGGTTGPDAIRPTTVTGLGVDERSAMEPDTSGTTKP